MSKEFNKIDSIYYISKMIVSTVLFFICLFACLFVGVRFSFTLILLLFNRLWLQFIHLNGHFIQMCQRLRRLRLHQMSTFSINSFRQWHWENNCLIVIMIVILIFGSLRFFPFHSLCHSASQPERFVFMCIRTAFTYQMMHKDIN